jgi:glycosyltransferase involved in cell wall biosynthesis
MPSIVALLPAYNEEISIGSMVLRARQYADRVVVIDDGSRDRTAYAAEEGAMEHFLVTAHRQENADSRQRLGKIIRDLERIGWRIMSDRPRVCLDT